MRHRGTTDRGPDAAVAARASSPMASGYRAPADRTLARPVRITTSTPTSGPSASTCRASASASRCRPTAIRGATISAAKAWRFTSSADR